MNGLRSFGRFASVIAIGTAAYVFAKFQGGFVSWFIFYTLIPFVTYSVLLYLYPLRDLTVERYIEKRHVSRNGQVSIRVVLKRNLPFPLLYAVLMDKRVHAKREKMERKIILLGFRRTYEYNYSLKNVQRGEYTLPAVEVEVVDFFNWICKRRVFVVQDHFLVYPSVTAMVYESASNGTSQGQQLSAYMLVKDATTPSSVREYAPGDRMSWIHWKSFARTSKLMTKEFDEQRSEQHTLLLDCGISETFESAVEFAASIVVSARQHHAKLTMITASDQPKVFPLIQSADQTRQALVHLAKIQPTDIQQIRLPVGKAVSRDALLLITGDLRINFIRRVLTFAPDASAIVCFVMLTDETNKKSLESIIDQVKLLGITVQLIYPSDRSSALKKAVKS
ncbi:hypothetical protein CSV72_06955 [Sporosarcina sp. P20a]|uniref:DUF58 domain-containing protein n=1 Tax=Sporosarcina sp. P20a TaxID=2048256 RepID=UPI000C171BCA|nr:DUF58 domain-containing protein [Sporosarcina sp. P20a]PIC86837.1 hypothetical protein CSV72_06955 [Sporosarcina sp. P20a]